MNDEGRHAGPSAPTASSSRRLAAQSTTQSLSPSSSLHRRRIQRPPRPLKVVLIGPGSVGKTSLRQTYFTNRFQHNYKATIGADFEAKVVEYEARLYARDDDDSEGSSDDGEGPAGPSSRRRRALLTIWDTAGQERFRALGSAFYRGADAAMVCFDASCEDEETVRKGIEEWYEEFAKHAGLGDEEKKRFCWVAVGCKADLRGEGEGVVVSRRKVREWLDALMPRGPVPNGAGAAVVTGHGDRPPADPTEVLAREGRHAVDDEELSLAAKGVAEAADPAEGDEPSVGAGANGEATVQDGAKEEDSGNATIGRHDESEDDEAPRPFPSSSPPRTPPTERQRSSSGHATINGNSASQSAASTPPKTLHLPPPAQSSSAGSSVNGAPPASAAAISSRNRLDSTRSFASTATGTTQMSVYHTPRNSAFWNGSATSAATTSSSIATATGSPVRYRGNGKARRDRSVSAGSGSTTKMGAQESDEDNDEQPTRTARLRRALTPSSTSTVVKKHNGAAHENGLDVPPTATRSTSRQTLHGDPDEDRPSRPTNRRPLSTPSLQSLAPATAAATKAASPPPPLEGFSLFYTSSLDGTNVRAVFEHVVSRCARRWEWEDFKARAEASDDPTGSPGKGARGTQQRRKSKVLAKRRSWWMGGGTVTGGPTRDEDGFALETRRMVRLSDGKGDDSARLFGGCC